MDYGFDFTNNICYISTFDGKEMEDLDRVSCPETLEERILFAENYKKKEEDRLVLVFENKTPEVSSFQKPGIIMASKEDAFASYLLEQKETIYKQETAVFEFHDGYFSYLKFHLQGKMCFVAKSDEKIEASLSEKQKDRFFTKQAANRLNHGNTANVFLVGEEFEGEWMKMSLASLCSGRRVFMGNHLFANGALYLLKERSKEYMLCTQNHHVYYWGIRAFHHGQKDVFVPILQPGQLWFQTEGSVQILIEECDELKLEGVHSIHRTKLEITLPIHIEKYKIGKTKLNIKMYGTGPKTLKILVYDMGFGVSREGKGMIYQEEFKLP